jgi:hypothetical protein
LLFLKSFEGGKVLYFWMKRAAWVTGAAGFFWLVSSSGTLLSQGTVLNQGGSGAAGLESAGLQMIATPLATGTQVVVLDPSQRCLAVYQVDAAGNLALKCVRNLAFDLRMEEFNGLPPLPSELRRNKP